MMDDTNLEHHIPQDNNGWSNLWLFLLLFSIFSLSSEELKEATLKMQEHLDKKQNEGTE